MRQYRARIGHPKYDDTWDRIMGILEKIVLIPKADLLDMAYEIYEGVFDCCFSYELIDIENEVHATISTNLVEEPVIHFKEVHKFTVKVIEMYHWRYNQVCGYGSNRQHQMFWWLDMDACVWDAAFRQDMGPWRFGSNCCIGGSNCHQQKKQKLS